MDHAYEIVCDQKMQRCVCFGLFFVEWDNIEETGSKTRHDNTYHFGRRKQKAYESM